MKNGEGLGKDQSMDPRTRIILYVSFIIILVLAAIMHLSTTDTQSLAALFLIAAIVVSNISYFYNKSRRTQT